MNRIYIVEGMDRCGKSSFIRALRKTIKNHKIMTIHSATPPNDVDAAEWTKAHYTQLMHTCVTMQKFHFDIILDRSWVGEEVYGALYRGTNFTERDFGVPNGLKLLVADAMRLIVFIDSPENCKDRDDGLGLTSDLDNISQEREMFEMAESYSSVNSKMCDWSKEANTYSEQKLYSLAEEMVYAKSW